MVSKNQIKLITSLVRKKGRDANKLFFAEGEKVIRELIEGGFSPFWLFSIDGAFAHDYPQEVVISEAELKKISALSTPNNSLAVFKIPEPAKMEFDSLTVVLDDVRDPGNLGTIIRLCDWFGISQIVCSPSSADCFNPKVVQASMGSLSRVKIYYVDIPTLIAEHEEAVYGTFMDGDDIYSASLSQNGFIVFGNEANGISPDVEKLVTSRIAIPRFGKLQKTESLNVATATAIVLSEFRRR